ncbi:MAG: efflux RND transporter periplasmic adaptor subunit [Acidobacteria bacterium]|nr:efflux RND transporter periplasmic adaptor subunit [Acidobacteriota bacterium]
MIKHLFDLPFRNLLPCALVLIFTMVAVGCGSGGENQAAAANGTKPAEKLARKRARDAIAVYTTAVRREPLSSLYSTSATLRADKRAVVQARTRGVIRELLVEEGDQVEAGQVLIHLEDDEQKIAADRARVIRDTRQRESERSRELHSQGMVSDEDFETRRRELEEAIHAAALADLNLSRTLIRAPFEGIILKRHLDVGATVADNVELFDLADLDPLYADVNIPERHVTRLGVGQTVRLTADATAEEITARIERIAPSVDPGTGTVKVTLAIVSSTVLRPGAFVRVAIVTDTHDEAIVVPRSALVAEGRRWHLFRIDDEESSAEQIEVKLGYEEGDRVEILDVVGGASPLEPGTSVVTVGAPALTNGALVRVMKPEPSQGHGESLVTP